MTATKLGMENLASKIAMAIADLPDDIEPEGTNPHFRYKYYTESQVSGLFRRRLASRGVIMIPHVIDHAITERETRNGRSYLTSMLVGFTLTDGNEVYEGSALGQGDDAADKGANKALTAATKYFLLKLGLVGGDSDAEADAETDRRASGGPQDAPGRPIGVGPSSIQGVQRGGRSTNATEAQIKKVRLLARDLSLDPYGVAIIIAATIDKDAPDLPPADEEGAGPMLVEYMSKLSADELGLIIGTMTEMKETSEAKQIDEPIPIR